jgi:RimJ/RimL family protein N-acetyltransferase
MEVLWRLLPRHWGCGYATEAARACVAFAFEKLRRHEVVSFTVPANVRSRAVMERLGMTHEERDDFQHPRLAIADPLRQHVLYRLLRNPSGAD